MPNPNLINSNSSIVSPFREDCTVHIPYTNAKTFLDVVLPNHVGEKELKYADGVRNEVLTKMEIKKDEMLIEIIMFIINSRCSKHMTGNLKLLINFVKKFPDFEVAFHKSTCYIRDLKDNDLLIGSRRTNLYSITLQETTYHNPICLMAKASSSQAWLWHRHLLHLNFDTINLLSKNDIVNGLPKMKFVKDHLCSSCELGKAKRKSFKSKSTPSSKGRSKDETPEVLIDFLRMIQRELHAQVRTMQNHRGTQFLNKTLHEYFSQEGIVHQTSIARTTEQNGVVERRNRTLIEVAQTMLIAAKLPLFFWAEAIATAYGENIDKMKEKGDACIFVRYSTQSKGYIVYNKRTRLIVETIHVTSDELPQMASDHDSSNPALQCQTMALEHNILGPDPQSQENVATADMTVTTSLQELEILFENVMVDEDEFINIFDTPVHEVGESSSRHDDPSNMHTFYQRHLSEYHWTKDHPLEKVLRNPSHPVRTRRQLDTDGEMCMFALTVSQIEPKNLKEAMADHDWIEAMQEELY
ncbi:putative ribonuclease H-like domain-containing protein [Tanacetum coccineum]